MMRLGIVGWGAIGRGVGERVLDGATPEAQLSAILRRSDQPATVYVGAVSQDLPSFLNQRLDCVLEAASAECLRQIAEPVLGSGCTLVAMSASALVDDAFRDRAVATARASGGKICVPAGALAGLDAVSAAVFGGPVRVEAIQRKPPAALLPPEEAAQVDAPRELARVTPREAGRRFPRNANIMVGLGLAAGDLDAPSIRIVADPAIARNQVAYEAEGAFGRLQVQLESEPSANRRTSQMAIYSALGAIRRLSEPLVIGA